MRSRVAAFAAILISLSALGCGSASTPRSTPATDSAASVGPLRLTPIAAASEPVALATRPDDPTLYIAERGGLVRPLRDGAFGESVLDLRNAVRTGGERGLLGMTFSPDGRFLFVHYSNRDGDTRVDSYTFRDGRADPGSRRELIAREQPYPNHNGGALIFGPDGNLYLGLGDGGSQGDPDDNAQRLGVLLGKILRVTPTPEGPEPYTVPAENPFVATSGARPEVWTYGLRNPWRFSFDRDTGDLWIGDVGAGAREEIDWRSAGQAAGTNFGWSRFEGTRPATGMAAPNAVAPVFEYSHDAGCAVTGGYVYRGSRIPALRGRYLFADYCAGVVRGLRLEGGTAVEDTTFELRLPDIVSFGEDRDGELYVLSLDGTIARIEPGS